MAQNPADNVSLISPPATHQLPPVKNMGSGPSAAATNKMAPHKAQSLDSYFAKYDSVYYWQWDTNTANWSNNVPFQKYTNIAYDSRYNILGYIIKNWNGTAWDNYMQIVWSYNSANRILSTVYLQWSG